MGWRIMLEVKPEWENSSENDGGSWRKGQGLPESREIQSQSPCFLYNAVWWGQSTRHGQIMEIRTSIWPGQVLSTWHYSPLKLLHPSIPQACGTASPPDSDPKQGSEGLRNWLKVRRVPHHWRSTQVVECRVNLFTIPVCSYQPEPWGPLRVFGGGSSHRYDQSRHPYLWHTNHKGQGVTAEFRQWFQFHDEEKRNK